MTAKPLWQCAFVVPAAAVDPLLDGLEDEALSIAAFEEQAAADGGPAAWWRIELLQDQPPDEAGLRARLGALTDRLGSDKLKLKLSVAELPAADWVAKVQAEQQPQRIGRFWVHGSHAAGTAPEGCTPIEIDAGLAFGSGEHATTQGCLLALDDLARQRRFRQVLDLGCGSGILGIAAAKCWPALVVAADNDSAAVAVTAENAMRNGVASRLQAVASDGYANPLLRARGPYDLILANILADPLCALARPLSRHLQPSGIAVLSGLLERQARTVIAAHERYGLFLRKQITIGAWTSLLMSRKKG
jgi:ribosomal protein L11 methyltransferase